MGTDWSDHVLLEGGTVLFAARERQSVVVDTLDRRKEVVRYRIAFEAADVPALGTAAFRLVLGRGPSTLR